jgi:glycosyltransferase involved in cell wall biosynthesis
LSACPPDPSGLRTALFIARLAPWKGLLLAVRSLVHAPSWRLVVFGEGRDQADAIELAQRLGVAGRLEFRGSRPRREVLTAMHWADAVLAPTFHVSGPWSVGEASALGCPVVCLDVGGPALMAGTNGHVIAIGDGASLPERIGGCLEGLGPRGVPDHRWAASRLPALLAEWYSLVPSNADEPRRTVGARS